MYVLSYLHIFFLLRVQISETVSCVLLGFVISIQGGKSYIYIYIYMGVSILFSVPNEAPVLKVVSGPGPVGP